MEDLFEILKNEGLHAVKYIEARESFGRKFTKFVNDHKGEIQVFLKKVYTRSFEKTGEFDTEYFEFSINLYLSRIGWQSSYNEYIITRPPSSESQYFVLDYFIVDLDNERDEMKFLDCVSCVEIENKV